MRGGARPGSGRKKGSKNTSTIKREESLKLAVELVTTMTPNCFEGDSHALLMAVYKNQDLPLATRLDAAKAAICFEKPRLGSTNLSVDDKRTPEQFTDAELEAYLRASSTRALEAPDGEAESGPVH